MRLGGIYPFPTHQKQRLPLNPLRFHRFLMVLRLPFYLPRMNTLISQPQRLGDCTNPFVFRHIGHCIIHLAGLVVFEAEMVWSAFS